MGLYRILQIIDSPDNFRSRVVALEKENGEVVYEAIEKKLLIGLSVGDVVYMFIKPSIFIFLKATKNQENLFIFREEVNKVKDKDKDKKAPDLVFSKLNYANYITDHIKKVIFDVTEERLRQDFLFKETNEEATLDFMILALTEELGELAQAVVNNRIKNESLEKAYTEAIQTSAMAANVAEKIKKILENKKAFIENKEKEREKRREELQKKLDEEDKHLAPHLRRTATRGLSGA